MTLRVMILTGVLAVLAGTPAWPDDALTASPDGPEAVRVYYTEAEALAKVFHKKAVIASHSWTLSGPDREALESRLGRKVPEAAFVLHRGTRDDKDLGWAVVLEEKGRFKPITFMVHVKPDGDVGLVLVMVYRESRGDGVKRQRFLKQFRGRGADDTLRLNRNVVGVSGATLSSRALTAGVRKALVLGDIHFGSTP